MTKAQEEACRGRTRTATSRGARHKEAAPSTATPVDVPADASGAHQAAYTKGPEDAARWLDAQEAEHVLRCFFESAKLLNGCASAIRTLSPLPPGSRVVVVPPEGSAEFEALVERLAEAILRATAVGVVLTHVNAPEAVAALRALTGGADG